MVVDKVPGGKRGQRAAQLKREAPFVTASRLVARLGSTEASMSTAKEELVELIEQQPEDSSREEIIRELAFHATVQRGLADSDAGRTVANEEVGRRIRSWQR